MSIKRYKSEPLSDFQDALILAKYQEALLKIRKRFGKIYPLRLGDRKIKTKHVLDSLNPNIKSEVIGRVYMAGIPEADIALGYAKEAFKTWSLTPAIERSRILRKAAKIMKREKFDLAALMTLEVGKSYAEADADVAEAIDFLNYYALQILDVEKKWQLVFSHKGREINEFKYIPLGVGAIISPWNFPLAILTGMTAAAIVCGNTVVVKPAATTPIIAHYFYRIMEKAGLPYGVINLIPGSGSVVGKYFVEHKNIAFINFTGSREVGLDIVERAAKTDPNRLVIKRVMAEMGGKDAMIVSRHYDIKKAATLVMQSAFGFSGQKCSAASRAIIDRAIYQPFLEELKRQISNLNVGNTEKAGVYMGAVNDAGGFKKICDYIEIGKSEGELLVGGQYDDSIGYYIQPTVFYDLKPSDRLMQEEIFGPVLAVTPYDTIEQAIQIANDTDYGLTGGFLSNDKNEIEYVKKNFFVGNLYINRKCTGAVVGYQPFGGFKMSGTDAKAGGPDHLLLFMQGQTITEAL
ncbi:MAG: L-glutamate gamma-semialdehyde dehydrogenase [Bacilli bacterium]|jgi:1-pyrroline-5-carboxylate dehydrogenase|nr:L-glutamate gamma-semialdehyde dehydrogenase [Bacilli bacterium]MDD4006058.1 L-glutamate gamma-semialdehyde dehydrogenase [Bacilli bacterium]